MITISRPELVESGSLTRLQASVQIESEAPKTLFFEVDNRYAPFLTVDRSDAFVVALLPIILARGGVLSVDNSSLSSHLYFSLKHIFSPVVRSICSQWSPLQINCEVTSTPIQRSVNGVGTGCSAGIDSLATISEYLSDDTPADYRLTHLLFLNAGSHNMFAKTPEEREDLAKKLYEGRKTHAEALSKELGLELIVMNTNLYDFVGEFNHQAMHTYWDSACVLALQNLFVHYMYASGIHLSEFSFRLKDPAYAEHLFLECFSTENTQIHSALSTLYRYERTEIVSRFPLAKKYLNVCLWEVENCGKCTKCVRTMFQLDHLGKLDEFREVFPVGEYREHPEQVMEMLKKDVGFHQEYTDQFNSSHPDQAEQRAFASKLKTIVPKSSTTVKTQQGVEEKIKDLQRRVAVLSAQFNYRRVLTQYYRYKILSKITWGKKRRHYKEKRRATKGMLRGMRPLI